MPIWQLMAKPSPKRCGPEPLSQVIRAHWMVENRLHGRRDVTLGEDRCGVRFPPLAQMLAVLNTVLLSLMDSHQVLTSLAKSDALPLTLTRPWPGYFDLDGDF